MNLLHYSLIILLSCTILYAQEEPTKKVPDLDPVIKNIIGFLQTCTGYNTNTNPVYSSENTVKDFVEAMQWAGTDYPPESLQLILWNHGAEFSNAELLSRYEKTTELSNKK